MQLVYAKMIDTCEFSVKAHYTCTCTIFEKLQLQLCNFSYHNYTEGAQWLSGRVLDSRPKGHGFEPHRSHCVVVLKQDTFILA